MKNQDKLVEGQNLKSSRFYRVAKRLNALFHGLPIRIQRTLGVLLFTGAATYAALLIRDGLNGESQMALPEPIISLKVPAIPGAQTATQVSKAEYEQLLKAEKGLDSLRQICPACYDQLLLAHPGFGDSLRHILRMYQNQITKPIQTNQP